MHDMYQAMMFSIINEIVLYDVYAHVIMYGYAMFLWYSLAGENKSRIAAGEYEELSSSFSLEVTTKDDLRINCRENNSAGE